MNITEFVRLAAVVLAASWASYSLEAVAPLHPALRRGAQGAIMLAAAYALLHAFKIA